MLSKLWSPLDGSIVRRRGGWRQRAAIAVADDQGPPPSISRLAAGQLRLWADGELPASKLQIVMEDAVTDGLNHPMVVRLSRIQPSQHAHQSLMVVLKECTAVVDDIRSIDGAIGETGTQMLAPSSIIKRLYKHYPLEFNRRLGAGDPARVRCFWEQLYKQDNHKWLNEHHFLRTLSMDELQYVVPLVLHEDAAPITKLLGANMISFSSILGVGDEKLTHFLCASYIKRKKDEAGDHTPMWNALLADFEALITTADSDSRGPWRFLLLFVKGDEEVRCVEWGLQHYNASEECCSECKADRSGRPWTDMRRGASWRGTEGFTLEQYRARIRQPLHPLANSKFLWRFFFFLDMMHVLDCKGVASTIFGSLLTMLVRDARLGATQQVRLDLVNTKLRAWYASRPGLRKLPKINLQSLVGSSGWAELAGPAIKAAPTRAAAPFFAHLAKEYFNSFTPGDLNTCKVTANLAEFYDIIASAPMFMTDAQLQRLRLVVDNFGIALQSLRGEAEARNQLVYQVRPKVHKAMHLPLFASIINPRCVNCYVDESQMGTSQRVWRASVKGKYSNHVQRTVLAKRWLALLLRFEFG